MLRRLPEEEGLGSDYWIFKEDGLLEERPLSVHTVCILVELDKG